jgi:hypothetical protein
VVTYLLNELSPSWEADNCAATQEISSILWNPKVHHCVHKSLPLVPILSQIDPVHTIPSCPSKICFNIVHLPTSCSSYWSLSLRSFIQGICCRLSATAYSIYSHLPLHNRRPSLSFATWGHAMPWWQGTHLTWTKVFMLIKIFLNETHSQVCIIVDKL